MRVSRGARVLVAAATMAATGLTAAAAFAGGGVPRLPELHAPGRSLPPLPQRPGALARRPHARPRARAAADRPLCPQRRRLPERQLPHPDAPGRPPLRAPDPPDARAAPRLPAADERPRVLGRLRARADHVPRPADRPHGTEGR